MFLIKYWFKYRYYTILYAVSIYKISDYNRGVLDYIELKDGGEAILKDPVVRLFPSDNQVVNIFGSPKYEMILVLSDFPIFDFSLLFFVILSLFILFAFMWYPFFASFLDCLNVCVFRCKS